MNDYLLHEMAKIRIDELRTEAARARAAGKARGSRGHERHLGFLGRLWPFRSTEVEGFSRGTSEEACCA